MDVRMPDLDGISATREVLAVSPEVKVAILTTFEQDDYIFGALSAGASGFLLKRTKPEELIAAIHTLAAGDSLLSPSVTRRVIERMAGTAGRPSVGAKTPRRADPARARGARAHRAGLSNGEIAAAFVIEESTVKTHVKRILMKLHLRDRVQAVIFAYESGLAQPGPKARPEAPSVCRPVPANGELVSDSPYRARRSLPPSSHWRPALRPRKNLRGEVGVTSDADQLGWKAESCHAYVPVDRSNGARDDPAGRRRGDEGAPPPRERRDRGLASLEPPQQPPAHLAAQLGPA